MLEWRIGISGAAVISLIKELFGWGYNLYVDNWYTSHLLFQYLCKHYTVHAGTARKNETDLPISFKVKNLERKQQDFRKNKNLLAVKFRDKKEILMLSTIHTAEVAQTGKKKIAVKKMFKNQK